MRQPLTIDAGAVVTKEQHGLAARHVLLDGEKVTTFEISG
jgi:hypothetical protein